MVIGIKLEELDDMGFKFLYFSVILIFFVSIMSCQPDRCKFYDYNIKTYKGGQIDKIGEELVCKCRDSSIIHLAPRTTSYYDNYIFYDSCLFSRKYLIPILGNKDSFCFNFSPVSLACVKKKKDHLLYSLNGFSWENCIEYSFTHWTSNGEVFLDSGKAVISIPDSIIIYYEFIDVSENVYIEEIDNVFF